MFICNALPCIWAVHVGMHVQRCVLCKELGERLPERQQVDTAQVVLVCCSLTWCSAYMRWLSSC